MKKSAFHSRSGFVQLGNERGEHLLHTVKLISREASSLRECGERTGACVELNRERNKLEECRKRCQDYDRVLLYTTQAEVTDSSIFSEALASRTSHEEITREMLKEFREAGISCFALSGDSCQICSKCAYPDSCRHPDMAIPCIESYGILVVDLTEKYQIDFYTDMHTVTWFGLIFYREKDRE